MVEHKFLSNYICNAKQYFTSIPIVPLFTNYVFDLTATSIFVPLIKAGTIKIIKGEIDIATKKVFSDNQITNLKCTPSHISILKDMNITKRKNLHSIILGGEKIDLSIIEYIHNTLGNHISIYNEYGPTETTIGSMSYIIDNTTLNTIGTPIDNTSIYILDKNLNILPKGAIGTLYIGGIGLARGYLNNDKLTEQKFIPNPYQTKTQKQVNLNDKIYNSGDLARINKDNQIVFIGRDDDQVKIRGFRIELSEIEKAAQTHSKIDKAIAIAKDNQIILYYKPTTNVKNNESITKHLQSKLPDYMIPSFIIPIDKIPLTENGKLNKNALPSIDTINKDKQIIKPANNLEAQLLDIFSHTLKVNKQNVSTLDSFFYLGGDSIKAIIAVNLINKLSYNDISLTNFITNKTIKNISMFIEDSDNKFSNVFSTKSSKNTIKFIYLPGFAGSLDEFENIYNNISKDIQLLPISYPGHDYNSNKALIADVKKLIDYLVRQIQENISKDDAYFILGYSLGAYLLYYLLIELQNKDIPLPKHVFFLACNSPNHKSVIQTDEQIE